MDARTNKPPIRRKPPGHLAHCAEADGLMTVGGPCHRASLGELQGRERQRTEAVDKAMAVAQAKKGHSEVSPLSPKQCVPLQSRTRTYPGSVPLTVGKTSHGILIEEPPKATKEQVASYLTALATAPRVPAEVAAEREATCAACPHARWSREQNAPWCSKCGCKVGGKAKGFLRHLLKKLTEVAENLPAWGCHHPDRAKGAGWKR